MQKPDYMAFLLRVSRSDRFHVRLWDTTEFLQCLRHSLEENVENDFLVVAGDEIDLMRQGEDVVEVGDGEQFRHAGFEPPRFCEGLALWTMPVTAGVIGMPLEAAGVALLDMPAESRRTAKLNGAHNFQM